MNVNNINSWDLSNDNTLKSQIENMNKREEQCMIHDSKKYQKEGKYTKEEIITMLNQFMGLWEPNTRKFYYIPNYIKELEK